MVEKRYYHYTHADGTPRYCNTCRANGHAYRPATHLHTYTGADGRPYLNACFAFADCDEYRRAYCDSDSCPRLP